MTRFHKTRSTRHVTMRRRGTQQPRRLGTTITFVLGFLIVLGLGLLYVNQVNTVATSGLAIQDLERKASQLEQANQDLELQAAALRSLPTVEQSSKDLQLVVRAKIEYLPGLEATVARSK